MQYELVKFIYEYDTNYLIILQAPYTVFLYLQIENINSSIA
jgi:hypothetical protein